MACSEHYVIVPLIVTSIGTRAPPRLGVTPTRAIIPNFPSIFMVCINPVNCPLNPVNCPLNPSNCPVNPSNCPLNPINYPLNKIVTVM